MAIFNFKTADEKLQLKAIEEKYAMSVSVSAEAHGNKSGNQNKKL
jgi:hypothetical protein